jgi:hypothetical protein
MPDFTPNYDLKKPLETEFYDIQDQNENMDKIDAALHAQEEALSNTTVDTTFTEAGARQNIVSGETLPTLFGKIKKWFSDLKAVAFSGSYADLSNKPTIPSPSADTPNMDGTAATGSSTSYARGDHVHPTDTSRAASSHNHAASALTSGTVAAARLPAASTTQAGIVQLNNTLTSTSTTQALTAAQGKSLKDSLRTLTSRENLSRITYWPYTGDGNYVFPDNAQLGDFFVWERDNNMGTRRARLYIYCLVGSEQTWVEFLLS